MFTTSSNTLIDTDTAEFEPTFAPGDARPRPAFNNNDTGLRAAVATMPQSGFSDAIATAGTELSVEIASTPEQVREAQQIRDLVYRAERGLARGLDGFADDCFDLNARHVLLRSRFTGVTLGTIRMALPAPGAGLASLPMARVCAGSVFSRLPATRTGEVSRFVVTRDRTGISQAAAALMRLCLIRGLIEISLQAGLTHWCGIMEKSLLRLLHATSIHFQSVGPMIASDGPRQPVVAVVDSLLSRARREQPVVWRYLTDNGSLWSEASRLRQEDA